MRQHDLEMPEFLNSFASVITEVAVGLFFFYIEIAARVIVPATVVGMIIYYPLWRIVSKFAVVRGLTLLIFPPVLGGLIFGAAVVPDSVPDLVAILAVLALTLAGLYVVGLTVWMTLRILQKFDQSKWWLALIIGSFVLAPFIGAVFESNNVMFAFGPLGYIVVVWRLALLRDSRSRPLAS